MSPDVVQNVDLHHDEWGTVGSVIFWNYTHEGKEKVAKQIIEGIDEEKKSVTFNVIEGDLMEFYKTFKAIVHVDTIGEDNLVTWTFEYEKVSEDVTEQHTLIQHTLMDLCVKMTKDIESHHLTNAG
ncbi:hypothetical protein ACP275_12G066800 [Erythranthe tilingii]